MRSRVLLPRSLSEHMLGFLNESTRATSDSGLQLSGHPEARAALPRLAVPERRQARLAGRPFFLRMLNDDHLKRHAKSTSTNMCSFDMMRQCRAADAYFLRWSDATSIVTISSFGRVQQPTW